MDEAPKEKLRRCLVAREEEAVFQHELSGWTVI